MVSEESHQKVQVSHLRRSAYLYVRQSTLRQVFENSESTKRQYALRQRAVALGWAEEQIVVIDTDLGQSGASARDREGFQHLVAEVSLGKAGIVLGLEVSRLARNSTDWHRLLELCALSDTLILDEDGIYDPAHFNDRLLLGLKGTMSEAELHVLKARLQGGILNKARRGELAAPLPVGFLYDPAGKVVLDPDAQVQAVLRLFFDTFRRTGSATRIVKSFIQEGVLFPRRLKKGPHKGDLVWAEITFSRSLQLLHNPRYAGAFVYGRTRMRMLPDGTYHFRKRPRSEWILLTGVHAGYIGWDEYEENQRRLLGNAQAMGADRRRSPPREGPALLQGLVLCGVCGDRMTVRYQSHKSRIIPYYLCQRQGIEHGKPICQYIKGDELDEAMSDLILATMTPMTIDIALAVQEEIASRLAEVKRLHEQQVERARYEADLAERRYLMVDPSNRLVADVLEAEWNARLRALREAKEEYERAGNNHPPATTETEVARLATLVRDFPRVWRDPLTPVREKKRMMRLLIEDVTLAKGKTTVDVHVRFKGGRLESMELPVPPSLGDRRRTDQAVVREIDRLLDDYTEGEIALRLNAEGMRSGVGNSFTLAGVHRVRRAYHLRSRYSRLRGAGLLTVKEVAALSGKSTSAVKYWKKQGLLHGHPYNDKGECLYEPAPAGFPGRRPRIEEISRSEDSVLSNTTDEV